VSHYCWEGDVLKETTMANERWLKGPTMAALTSIEPKPYLFVRARKPKVTLRPLNELPPWMVGGEDPQE
jgi:hypothetical protein